MRAGPARTLWLFAREAFADALRRRLVLMLALMTGSTLLFLQRCTAAFTGNVEVNGRQVALEQLGPAVGVPLFAILALGTAVLGAILAGEELERPVGTGEASLWLARPVSRDAYALGRLVGALGLALGSGLAALAAAAVLLHQRQGLELLPAVRGAGVCALGTVAASALAMALSVWIPRLAATFGVGLLFAASASMDVFSLAGHALEGTAGLLQHYGPPLLAAEVYAVAGWNPTLELHGSPPAAVARLAVWAVAGLALLLAGFRRLELVE